MWMSGEAAHEMEACTDAEVRVASSLACALNNKVLDHLHLPLSTLHCSAEQMSVLTVFQDAYQSEMTPDVWVSGRCMRASRRCWMPSQPSRCRETSRCCGRAGAPMRSTEGATPMCPLAPRLQMWRSCHSRWWGLLHAHGHCMTENAMSTAGIAQVPPVSPGQARNNAKCQCSVRSSRRQASIALVTPQCCWCSPGMQRFTWHDAPCCSVCWGGHPCAAHRNSARRLLHRRAGGTEVASILQAEKQCWASCLMRHAALRLKLRPKGGVQNCLIRSGLGSTRRR